MDIFWHAISFKKNYSPKTLSQEAVRYASLKYSHRPIKRRKWESRTQGTKAENREVSRSCSHSRGEAARQGAGCLSGEWATDILGEAGLHFDELDKPQVLDPEVTQQTRELKEGRKDFVDKIGQF